MVTPSRKTQQSERAPRAQDILRVWRGDRCLSASSAQQCLQWIGRFRRYCRALGLDEGAELGDAVLEFITLINADMFGLGSGAAWCRAVLASI